MSEHYFTNNPQSDSKPFQFQTTINSYNLSFETDDGVFSKKQIDYGTRVLLEQFIAPGVEGDLLDVGCGYGPIGITLGKSYPERQVDLIDINERAVSLANQNLQLNQISNAQAFVSDGIDGFSEKSYAAVVTNPPFRAGKQVVVEMIQDSFLKLKNYGELWLVAQKKQGAPSLKNKMEEQFNNVEVIKRDKGYYVLKSKRID
ncbi:class I SAM-dependent methyltransferase [Alkalibacillus silvisoli]|uniref:Class I SAM-dependent methyltransferase n=1 Tax=Alkalibacillus silvisoli TaxID=392823 RepID=A0ABN1A8A2_9BACI